MFAIGSVVVASSALTVASGAAGWSWLGLGLLTIVGGALPLKVPRVPATVSLSEVFVFGTILSFGQAPAILAVVADGLITSLRHSNRRLDRTLFNVTEPAISVWMASAVFSSVAGVAPLAPGHASVAGLLLPVLLMSATYFMFNSGLTATAVMWETGESPYRIWRTHFAWLSLNDFGSASIALFLAVSAHEITLGSIAAALPLVALLHFTFGSCVREIEHTSDHLAQLDRLHVATVESLAMAVDARDQNTHGHTRRVQGYALALAERMGITDEAQLKAIEFAALLHDAGKIAVPDHILNKPGRLTPAEYNWMKRHSVVGAAILSTVGFPYPVVPIVRHHHENWNGTGYPDGLQGHEIPVGARVLSVIDCYDALTSDRPYRRALTQPAALAIIRQRRGTMYDPDVVDAFLEIVPRLPNVAPAASMPLPREAVERPNTSLVEEPAGAAPDGPKVAICSEFLPLGELSDQLAGRVSFGDAAELIARHLRRLTPASLVVFFLAEPASDTLSVAHASGVGEHGVGDVRLRVGRGLSGLVAATGLATRNADPALDLGGVAACTVPRLQSALCAPLLHDGRVVGVMSLYAPGVESFTAAHARGVNLVSRPIAAALASPGRAGADGRGAWIDAATGLPNEQYLDALLTRDGWFVRSSPWTRVVVAIRFSSVVLPVAADMIRLAVAAVQEAVPGADLMFRSAPDELLVLLLEGDKETGRMVRARVVAQFAEIEIVAGGPPLLGCACAPMDGTRWEELVATARARRDVTVEDERRLRAPASA